MSLISPKHLIAPFRNQTHIFSIVGIVVFVALFRWMGGGFEVSQHSQVKTDSSEDLQESVDSYGNEEDLYRGSEEPVGSITNNDSDTITHQGEITGDDGAVGDTADQPPSENSLDDIEREMGIR